MGEICHFTSPAGTAITFMMELEQEDFDETGLGFTLAVIYILSMERIPSVLGLTVLMLWQYQPVF